MRLYRCERKDNVVLVAIMINRQDNKYHFVNLTHNHICECGFDTIEDAVKDMEKQKEEGKLVDFKYLYSINTFVG